MYKLLISFLFILSFSLNAAGQEPTPITLNENTATETTVVAKEVRLKRLIIDVADSGKFEDSRITVVSMIGLPSANKDPITGFTLFIKVLEQEIYNGTLSAYTQELETAVNNGVITADQKIAIIAGLVDIYKKSFDGFVSTANILQANGKLQLRAVKKAQ